MAEIKRTALFGKLNEVVYKAMESATVFCKSRGNPYVELIHWLVQMVQYQDSDLHRILRHFGVDMARLAKDFTDTLDRLPRGATSISDFSPHLELAVERGWVYASLLYGEGQIRSGYMVVGMLKTPELASVMRGLSSELNKLKVEQLSDEFNGIIGGSPEEGLLPRDGSAPAAEASADEPLAPAAMGRQEALARFSVDLTEKARDGEIDPIVGRDEEIRQLVDILMRRRQNNPILTGEAGVGKTAVVEGFALRIVSGDVPPMLKDVSLRALDLGLLQAGASMKGEFEQRLRQVIDEVQQSPDPIIMFIDEVHTLIGAGGAAGTGDAANLLKPALARGTLRTVAATTWDEYKKHIEKDPALTRRFQVVKVDEPSEAKAIRMMRGITEVLEKHHRIQILDEALEAAVALSHRYIPARQLPDKSVSLLDTACARVAVSQHAVPARIDDTRRHIEALNTELEILERERAIGEAHDERIDSLRGDLDTAKKTLGELEDAWSKEKAVVDQLLGVRAKLQGSPADEEAGSDEAAETEPAGEGDANAGDADEDLGGEIKRLEAELAELQGENPLVFPSVDQTAVASVVADWTGIPVGRMVKDEIQQVLNLADNLERRVLGQRHALDLVAERVQTNRAKLDNPQRPVGVFMLVGPSGTGKTETALALAEALYGGEQNLITINMSEFQEAHTVSTLKGAPPGYVGYGEGGVLTEAVRRKPYSVVLLDEVEKAHSDVHEIFFQVFDKGWMEDGEGREIDFKNTIILLTSNAAQDVIIDMCKDPELLPSHEGLEKAMREPLTKVFPDALLNRLVVVPYYPISRELLDKIISLNLKKVEKRIMENHGVPFTYGQPVLDLIAKRCSELERGARMVEACITNTMLPEIGREILNRMLAGEEFAAVKADVADDKFVFHFE